MVVVPSPDSKEWDTFVSRAELDAQTAAVAFQRLSDLGAHLIDTTVPNPVFIDGPDMQERCPDKPNSPGTPPFSP